MRFRNTVTGRVVDLTPEEARAAGVPSPHRAPRRGPRWVSLEEPETGKSGRPKRADVRAWAKEQGIDVPAKGKIPDDVVDRYLEAHADVDSDADGEE